MKIDKKKLEARVSAISNEISMIMDYLHDLQEERQDIREKLGIKPCPRWVRNMPLNQKM